MHCSGMRLGRVKVWIREQRSENKDQKKIEGTAKLLLAILDISPSLSITVE